jgi:hypothetical protein
VGTFLGPCKKDGHLVLDRGVDGLGSSLGLVGGLMGLVLGLLERNVELVFCPLECSVELIFMKIQNKNHSPVTEQIGDSK